MKRAFCAAAFLCFLWAGGWVSADSSALIWPSLLFFIPTTDRWDELIQWLMRGQVKGFSFWVLLSFSLCCAHACGCGPDLVRAALKEHKSDAVQKQGCRNPLPTLSLIYSYSGWIQMREHLSLLASLHSGKFFCYWCFSCCKARGIYLAVHRLPFGCQLRLVELFNSFLSAAGLSHFALQEKVLIVLAKCVIIGNVVFNQQYR